MLQKTIQSEIKQLQKTLHRCTTTALPITNFSYNDNIPTGNFIRWINFEIWNNIVFVRVSAQVIELWIHSTGDIVVEPQVKPCSCGSRGQVIGYTVFVINTQLKRLRNGTFSVQVNAFRGEKGITTLPTKLKANDNFIVYLQEIVTFLLSSTSSRLSV